MEMALMRWHNSGSARRLHKNIHEFANVCFAFGFRVWTAFELNCSRHHHTILWRMRASVAALWRFACCFHFSFWPVSARCFYTITNDGRHRQRWTYYFRIECTGTNRVSTCTQTVVSYVRILISFFNFFFFLYIVHARSVCVVIVCESLETLNFYFGAQLYGFHYSDELLCECVEPATISNWQMSFVLCARNSQPTRILCPRMARSRNGVRTNFLWLCENRSIDAVTIIASHSHHASWQSFDTVVRSFGCHESCFRCTFGPPNCACMRPISSHTSHRCHTHTNRTARIRKNTENASLRNCESFSMAFTSWWWVDWTVASQAASAHIIERILFFSYTVFLFPQSS